MRRSSVEQSKFVVLFGGTPGSSLRVRQLLGHTLSVVVDRDNPDTVYLVSSGKSDKKYVKIELDPSLTGVYRIVRFDPRLVSFILARVLPLPYYSVMPNTGLRVRFFVQTEEYEQQGFKVVFLRRIKTRTNTAVYIERIEKKLPGIVLYRRTGEGIKLVRVADTVFFSEPSKLPWYDWLRLCTTEKLCRGSPLSK